MVFLLTHLCEIDPVFSRIFLAELKKARQFSFRGKNNKEAAPGYTFGFVVARTIKQLLKTKQNQQPRLACTWIQSPENDRENQKVSSACASRDQPRKPVPSLLYFILHFVKPRLARSRVVTKTWNHPKPAKTSQNHPKPPKNHQQNQPKRPKTSHKIRIRFNGTWKNVYVYSVAWCCVTL